LLPRGKTDQEGEGALQYLSSSAIERLQRWMTLAGIQAGAIFRSTPKSGKPDRYDTPLSDRDVARIFKRMAFNAGIDPERISGHSTRVGAAQDLLAANFSPAEIMRQGRWKSERMIMRYGENLSAGRGAMAQLMEMRKRDQG
jgi:integrase